MCNNRLDARDRFPSGMEEYLSAYNWCFSKKMCEWAISRMKDRSGSKVSLTKTEADDILSRYGVTLEHNKAYDYVYVMAMAKADYYGSSIADDSHLAMFVKDYIDDPDGYDGLAFTRFYADCIGKGTPILWEDML